MLYLKTKNQILFFLDYGCFHHWMAHTQGKKKSIFLMWDITFFLNAELTNVGQEERG